MRHKVISMLASLLCTCISVAAQTFDVAYTAAVHPREVDIRFNAPLNLSSATNIQNYRLSNTNIVVTNAVLRADKTSIILQLSKPNVGSTYTLILGDLQSESGASLSRHVVAGFIYDWNGVFNVAEIGGATGSVFALSKYYYRSEFTVTAPEGSLGGTADRIFYVYHPGFPYMRVTATPSASIDSFKQTALIARESLDPGSRFFGIVVTRENDGYRISTLARNEANGPTSFWPISEITNTTVLPTIQLRGDEGAFGGNPTGVFTALISFDDYTNFIPLGKITPSFTEYPQQFSFGLVTISDAAGPPPNETAYTYRIEPHGDLWPMLTWQKTNDTMRLTWPSAFVVQESSLVPPIRWTPVTNHMDFGWQNIWDIDLKSEISPRFFRVVVASE